MPFVRISAVTHALIVQCKGEMEMRDKRCITFDTVLYESVQSYLRYLHAGR